MQGSTLKKCPNCHQWTEFNNGGDVCPHCNKSYIPPKPLEEELPVKGKFSFMNRKAETIFIVNVKPTDNFFVAIFKRLIQGGQIIFMAIISFTIWIVTLLAG